MRAKQKLFFCLVGELGIEVDLKRRFDWLTNKSACSDTTLQQIFIALGGDQDGMNNKKFQKLSPDGYLPEYKCIIEFDELQHFTACRYQTFQHYPHDVFLGFDIDAYRSWCEEHADRALKKGGPGFRKCTREFPFREGRVAQRALLDACRDLLPPRHGLRPTIRITEFELPSLQKDRQRTADELKVVLKGRLQAVAGDTAP